MPFNSLIFIQFFIIVYFLYLLLNHKWQNIMLLIASYVFYGAWDKKFMLLLLTYTVIDFFCAIRIYESASKKERRIYLLIGLLVNLSLLGFFKYSNFFILNLQAVLGHFGIFEHPQLLNVILPVGISFYTFKSMSYIIDVYRKEIEPTRNFIDFSLFISFFPQLLAGPIERAKHFLPQIQSSRRLTVPYIREGLYLLFWGFFEKIFIADNLAHLIKPFFSSNPPYNGAIVLLILYAQMFRMFCDFDGYSNIAIGLGKCMGFDTFMNFNLPYFATNPVDFWKRWHITLYNWFKDYVYIPLTFGGKKKSLPIAYRSMFIVMLLIGLWHGASWKFILWGCYFGVLLVCYRMLSPILRKIPVSDKPFIRNIQLALRIIFFFHLICLSGLILSVKSATQFYQMIHAVIFNFSISKDFVNALMYFIFFIFFLLIIQFFQFIKNDLFVVLKWPDYGKVLFIVTIIYLSLYMIILGKDSYSLVSLVGVEPFVYVRF